MNVTWETCDLRSWLNDMFLNAAFSANEQEAVLKTYVDNSKSQQIDSSFNAGNNTTDQVFLLSCAEAEKYFSSKSDRECKPTAYAEAQGAYIQDGNSIWWLRSTSGDESPYYVATVGIWGALGVSGYYAGDIVVRPAIWINLDDLSSAVSTPTPTPTPTPEPLSESILRNTYMYYAWGAERYDGMSVWFFMNSDRTKGGMYYARSSSKSDEGDSICKFVAGSMSIHGSQVTILDDYAFFFHMYSDDQYSDRLGFNFTKGNHVLTYTQIGNDGIHLSGTLEEESFDMDLYAQGSDKKDRLSKTIVSIFEKLEKINNA